MHKVIEKANKILDSIGAREQKNPDPKSDDKIRLDITRDAAVGLTLIQLKHYLATDFETFHKLAEFALNRSVWTHEFADPALKAELEERWGVIINKNKKR